MVEVTIGNISEFAWQELRKHRWIESQKAGHDLGEQACRQWFQCYWSGFFRERWLEHVCGTQLYIDFDDQDFGILNQYDERRELVDTLRHRCQSGADYVHVVRLTREKDVPPEVVRRNYKTLTYGEQLKDMYFEELPHDVCDRPTIVDSK
jgi:hypothetical protein